MIFVQTAQLTQFIIRGTVKKKKSMQKSRQDDSVRHAFHVPLHKGLFWLMQKHTFSPGAFSFDIYEHKRSCVHWPGRPQWIHYEPEQKSYSAVKERGANLRGTSRLHREDWFVNDHLEE